MRTLSVVGIALALALSSPAGLAQDHVVLTNHHVVHGKVVSSTSDSVTFDHYVDGESVEVLTYSVDELEPVSFYLVRHAAVDGDPEAMLELGQYCLAHDMSARARDLSEAAHRLDPALEGIDTLKTDSREASAAELLAKAQAQQAAGKPYDAWHTLRDCVRHFGETPSGQKAKDLVQPYFDAYQERYALTQEKEDASSEQRHLGEISKMLERADEHASEALSNKNLGQSLKGYEKAAKEYEHAVKKLDDLAKAHPDDADLQQTVTDVRSRAVDGAVQAHLNSAGVYMIRTAYQDALAEANHALAIDPGNNSAKSMRTRIATASSTSRL